MKKHKRSFFSFLVVGLLCMSILPIKAEPIPNPTVNVATVNFGVKLNTSVAGIFPNYSLDFEAKADVGNPSTQATLTQPPAIGGFNVVTTQETEADLFRVRDGKMLVTFADNAKIGSYKFVLNQKIPTTAQTGMTYDSISKYTVTIDIINQVDDQTNIPTGKTTIGSIVVNNEGNEKVALEIDIDTNGAVVSIKNAFANSYKAAGTGTEDPKDAALSLDKTVTGKFADVNKYFKFIVTVKDKNMANNQSFTILGGSSTDNPKTIVNNVATTLYLKHNEVIGFQGLSEDATYTIVEENLTNYEESYKINSGIAQTGLTASGNALLTAGEKVSFINKNIDIDNPPTGVFIEILPFILLGGVAVVIFVSTKRNKKHPEN